MSDDEIEKRRITPIIDSLQKLADLRTNTIREVEPISFFDKYKIHFSKIGVLKRNMLKKRLSVAQAKCPDKDCNGYWFVQMTGRRNHVRIRCNGKCGFNMME